MNLQRRKPEAILILCLRPREHLFLFYVLRQALPDYLVMIISDELFFSDWLVLKVYGGIPALPEQDLAEILIRARRGTPVGEGRTEGFSVISGSGDGLSGSATDI
nr:transcriptional regulator [Salmonella sp. NCTC 7297]